MGYIVDSYEFAKRKKVTVSNRYIDSTLTDQVTRISFVSDSQVGAICQSNGNDIRFTTLSGTLLNSKNTFFSLSSGHATADFLVLVSSLSSSVGTELYMYYGNATCPEKSNPSAIWPSKYKLSYHFNEASGDILDSTSNAFDAISHGTVSYR